MLKQASFIIYVWATAAKEGQRWFLYLSAYLSGMESFSHMQNTDSSLQRERFQMLSASEVGASSFSTSFVSASTADMGCALSIQSAPIFQSSHLCLRSDHVGSMSCQQWLRADINNQTSNNHLLCWKFSEAWALVCPLFLRCKVSTSENYHTTLPVCSSSKRDWRQTTALCVS